MSDREWVRTFAHPFQGSLPATHGKLRPTTIRVEPYTAFAVLFRWLLRENQQRIDDALPEPLPADESPPFPTPWVFQRTRQEALCTQFFGGSHLSDRWSSSIAKRDIRSVTPSRGWSSALGAFRQLGHRATTIAMAS